LAAADELAMSRKNAEARRDEALYGSALLAERAESYRRLMAEALPFARVELAWMKQRQHVTNERGMLGNIQAAFASTAMMRGEAIEETIARLWGVLADARRAA
jgi:hypothetical protein